MLVVSYSHALGTLHQKGFMSSEQVSADFSMHVSNIRDADSFLIIFLIEAKQQNIPMSYLLNLQLLQKERGETWKDRFVMDPSMMTMADKAIPNMGTCGVHSVASGSCLKGLESLLLRLHLPITHCKL